ncbi:MAG: acetyl-CoA carboxylase carboxyltransferase subunit alpha [Planctomycetes bacterium]|nr:acetyl-CoA carboxylase carboxyltransferase subunit alpha [Planctomycetota bacterium]MBI3834608.1 acetyl-CoA carboxylase carboxyltransferase subunit alpha [Planctomycetota bacterium]
MYKSESHPERRGWGAFGSYSLTGDFPWEAPLSSIESRIDEVCTFAGEMSSERLSEVASLRTEWVNAAKRIYSNLQPWQTVFVARHPQRPLVRDYIHHMAREFCELHGDRYYGDDDAMVTGLGWIGEHRVMIIGHNRGRSLNERVACHFGCAHPEGYRKALAKMQLAAKFKIPIVLLIDTPGAYPGMEAEERGIARAIAANLVAMPKLRVPLIAVVIGEGGSGGALGIGVSDRMAMLEHAIFSVISPEGCAAILWKTSAQAKEASEALKLRAADLRALGLIDSILPEPLGGAHRDHADAANAVQNFITNTLNELVNMPVTELLASRYARLRSMGSFYEQVCAEKFPPAKQAS